MSLLSLLVLATPLLASPTPLTNHIRTQPPHLLSTNVTLYEGTISGSSGVTSCGIGVAQTTYYGGVCNNIVNQGVGIQQCDDTTSCTFTLFEGVTDCNATAALSTSVYALPRGDGQTCVYTGVLDGGDHYHGSGIWACGEA